ncbi:MAG: hypothetical protein ABSH51_04735 [Solirubrobacteraceae bacterium]|jgi:hypothetical protein
MGESAGHRVPGLVPHVPGTRRGRHRALLATALLGTLAAVLAGTVPFAAPIPTSSASASAPASATGSPATAARLPLHAQGVISTTIAAGDRAFDARRVPGGYRLTAGGLVAEVGPRGARLRTAAGWVPVTLTGVGRGTRERALGAGRAAALANRVTLRRAGVAEWYAGGPLGIEQGFTVARRPAGRRGALTLWLRIGGTLVARRSGSGLAFAARGGSVVLRYGGLAAVDATGRPLPATLALTGDRLRLIVADRGARYPVRVDPFFEQMRLAPTDAAGAAAFGTSVALSADGNTALIGGSGDDGQTGAAWVFARSGTAWTEQAKLVPADLITSAHTPSEFGGSVALSADGNTALIGAASDGGGVGAVWVYVRSGTTWSEAQKIVPSDEIGPGAFGSAVALSAGATTALIGGGDDGAAQGGAAWIYGDATGSWIEQQKIAPVDEAASSPGAAGSSHFGRSVALSSSGTTALIGAPMDGVNGDEGAAWVYIDAPGGWAEETKMVPGDETGGSGFGSTVALSSAGSTALVGGSADGDGVGAAWVYAISAGNWSEQTKIVPRNEVAKSAFGSAVALSSDGSAALIGGDSDNGYEGAAWVYAQAGSTWADQEKFVPGDESGDASSFGAAVALSTDGSTALVGGPTDAGGTGAAWAYSTSGSPSSPGAPSCTLKARGDAVTLPPRAHRGKAARGDTLAVSASCDQKVTATLRATVTERLAAAHGKAKTRVLAHGIVRATLSADRTTAITVRVASSLVAALRGGTKAAAAFTLSAVDTNGSARAGARIARLRP